MSDGTSQAYCTRRAREERVKAEGAKDPMLAALRLELAARYDELANQGIYEVGRQKR